MEFKDERAVRAGQRGGPTTRQGDPNLMQILAACAVIRMGWSDKERRSRWEMSQWRYQARSTPYPIRELLGDWS